MVEVISGGETHIPVIIDIAEKTWEKTYKTILSGEQMRYMLDAMYSAESLQKVMREGLQRFIILKDNHAAQGFASFGLRAGDASTIKIHKLYVLPEKQGKGYGRMLIEDVKNRYIELGVTALELNVNRHNPARYFYEKLGFDIIREEDIPIGPYWMNDYVMRLAF